MSNDNEYMNDYMKARYRQRRKLAFSIIGDRCVNCGTSEDLEIDHIDREGVPTSKKFAKFWNIALNRFMKELEKCQPLCGPCHALKSQDDLGVGHGQGASGKRNCPCAPCKARKAQYMKDRKGL